MLQSLSLDLRAAVRALRFHAASSIAIIAILAVGIGVSGAMFMLVYTVLLRPLPFPEAEQLVTIGWASPRSRALEPVSLPDLQAWRAEARSLQRVAYWMLLPETLQTAPGSVRAVTNVAAGPEFFGTLGVEPRLGRTFTAADRRVGQDDVAVLSAHVWRDAFQAAPDVVGRTVRIGTTAFTIIGVMPDAFIFPLTSAAPIIWTPLRPTPESTEGRVAALQAVGRVRPDASALALQTELNALETRRRPRTDGRLVAAQAYHAFLTDGVRRGLLCLQIATLLVWLIACANAASLLLSRAVGRRHETAVRLALGVTRWRLLRQTAVEQALLCGLAWIIAAPLSLALVVTLRRDAASELPFADQLHLGSAVMGAELLLAAASLTLVSGFAGWYTSRAAPREILSDARSVGVARKPGLLWDALVGVQLALTTVLLISAGLLLRSVATLQHTPLGFDPSSLVLAPIISPAAAAAGGAGRNVAVTLYDPLLESLARIPGVVSVGLSSALPLQPQATLTMPVEVAGGGAAAPSDFALLRAISPDLHRTLGIRLRLGRRLTDRDGPSTPWVVIVNDAFVRRFLPDRPPLGERIRFDRAGPHEFATIVGIVEDTPQRALSEPPLPEVDISYRQIAGDENLGMMLGLFAQVALRTSSSPSAVIPDVRQAMRQIDPDLATSDITPMMALIDRALATERWLSRLLVLFAGCTLLTTMYGVHALVADNVARRTREIGIRMALGGRHAQLLGALFRRYVVVIGIGIAGGVAASAITERLMASFLHGVTPRDSLTVAGAVLLLAAAGVVASLGPASRAIRTDPAETLRM